MDPVISSSTLHMQKALDLLKGDLSTIRTGKASPSIVENIMINAYGGSAKLRVMELATVSSSDSQTLIITPFDPSIIGEMQKGIQEANIGLTPSLDGNVIRISIPPLSQERREQLIHLMKQKLENGRIMVRQARREAMDTIKKQELPEDEEKRLEKEIQKVTDDFILQIDNLGKQKEQELLQI